MTPIQTGTISTLDPDPAIMLVQSDAGGAITYVLINASPDVAIDMLRRALIHIVAGQNGLASVPASPALRLPKAKPAGAAPLRSKPGPKPGTHRRKANVESAMEF